MKKAITLAVLLACCAFAQQILPVNQQQGAGAPPAGNCAYAAQVGNMWNSIGGSTNAAYLCQQNGNGTLPTFGWTPVSLSSSTNTGSVSVAAGKAAVISNSLTFAGTDGTTETFPSTSITVPGTVINNCGTANACSATNISPTSKIVVGVTAVLNGASPAIATVTGMPAFTSSSSYVCTANVNSASASTHVLAINYVSSSSVTFTAANGATDTVSYACIGS